MSKLTKNQKSVAGKIEAGKMYTLKEASSLVKEITTTKFDASLDIDVRLGVDPRKSNQMVRGTVSLPNGTGKTVRVLCLCTPDVEEAAKAAGKPVFVDITGHGCVNCREMESRVWSDPRVLEILNNDYIVVALYTDDKQKLAEEDWVTTDTGDVLKTLGRANSYIVRTRFGVNAQPNYVLLSPEGEQLAPVRGYDLDIQGFVDFLESGLKEN